MCALLYFFPFCNSCSWHNVEELKHEKPWTPWKYNSLGTIQRKVAWGGGTVLFLLETGNKNVS